MSDYYKLEGRTVTKYATFEAYLEDAKATGYTRPSHVGDTTIKDVRISTVFLSMDHAWGQGLPLIFETMVFGGQYDQEATRCSTYDQAERQHAWWVRKVRKSLMSTLERAVRKARNEP